MATHSSIPTWRIPWTEEPGGLQSAASQRVRHDWRDCHVSKYLCYIVVATMAYWLQLAQFTAALRFQSWPQWTSQREFYWMRHCLIFFPFKKSHTLKTVWFVIDYLLNIVVWFFPLFIWIWLPQMVREFLWGQKSCHIYWEFNKSFFRTFNATF